MSEPIAVETNQGMSTGAKIAIGCGIVLLLCILACAGLGWYGWSSLMTFLDEKAKKYEEMGFTRMPMQQMVNLTDPVSEKNCYIAQIAKVGDGSETDVAFIAQVVEIDGTIKGDLHFTGQTITIKPGAVVEGDMIVECQVILIQGTVKGEVKGSYQTIVGGENAGDEATEEEGGPEGAPDGAQEKGGGADQANGNQAEEDQTKQNEGDANGNSNDN